MTSRHPQLLAPQVSSVHGAHGLSRPPPAALDFTSFSQGVCVRPKASIQLPHLLSSDPRIQAESRVGAPPLGPPLPPPRGPPPPRGLVSCLLGGILLCHPWCHFSSPSFHKHGDCPPRADPAPSQGRGDDSDTGLPPRAPSPEGQRDQ